MNVLPILIIGLVAALLAFDKRYEDGLIRHISLAVIVATSTIMVLYQWFSLGYDFSWELTLFLWGCAVFIGCHGYSFMRWRITGSGAWKHITKDVDEDAA